MKNVFVGWARGFGKDIAGCLRRTILNHNEINVFYSELNECGANWFGELKKELIKADYVVLILQPGASKKSWINFEGGFASGAIKSVKIVNFGDEIANPLAHFHFIDGFKSDELIDLRAAIVGSAERVKDTNYIRENWESELKVIKNHYLWNQELEGIESSLYSSILELKENKEFIGNKLMQDIFGNYLSDFTSGLKEFKGQMLIPQDFYPHFLISLLKKFRPVIKAIALVDVEEDFWQQNISDRIMRETGKDSTRIFVFKSKEQLEEHFDTLIKHAKKYNVRIMGYDMLTINFPKYNHDFSIISTNESSILALYENNASVKSIRFSLSSEEISEHHDHFMAILSQSYSIESEIGNEELSEEALKRAFPPKLSQLRKKHVEMSAYIQIHDYDRYEEDHAYYKEMMEEMLMPLREEAEKRNQKLRVLEFGAGTGIFTKKLASIPNLDIVTIEIDWACFKKLEHNMKISKPEMESINTNCECIYEDSRFYNPKGTFDFIFSSFADHHIKPLDKQAYFENLDNNLKLDGSAIIGDEFLPPHNDDADSWRAAVNIYHDHIIGKAKEQNNNILAQLEENARKSGLSKMGDFKVSCEKYESYLNQYGFEYIKTQIGPTSNENVSYEQVGGVFVYKVYKSN